MIELNYVGKTDVIFGGGSGIGEALARRFSEAGARVVLAGRTLEKLKGVSHSISEKGGEAHAYQVDIRSSHAVKTFFETIVAQFGRIDVACNSAGTVADLVKLTDVTEEDFDQVVDTNLKGTWLCMKYELLHMKNEGSGVILNVSSINGIGGTPRISIYAASKAAINHLTKTAALEHAHDQIRINALCPGPVEAPLLEEVFRQTGLAKKDYQAVIPQGRIASTQEIANTALWICSDYSSYMTGQIISVDGGITARS